MNTELLCAARLVRVCKTLNPTQLDELMIEIYRLIIRNSIVETGVYYLDSSLQFAHSCANVVQNEYTH